VVRRRTGESYVDSAQAARIGRFGRTVEDLQTPYAFPQENGNRRLVRWAELRGPDGGIRIEGDPTFELTVRRWTTEDLDAARHPTDLAPRDEVYVNIDLAQNGSAPHRADPACCRSTSCPPRRRPGPCGCGPSMSDPV